MKICNLPKGPIKRYVVFRLVNGEAWYYGDWDDYGKAEAAAMEIRGLLIPADGVEA